MGISMTFLEWWWDSSLFCLMKTSHLNIQYGEEQLLTKKQWGTMGDCTSKKTRWSLIGSCIVAIALTEITMEVKDRAHLSTFKIFIFEKFSCVIVLVVFLVIVQSSELVSVWFCEKMTFFPNCFSYHIFAIYVGGASLGLPTACRLIAVKVLLQWNSTSVYTSCTYSTYHLELALGTFICHFISACLVCHTS